MIWLVALLASDYFPMSEGHAWSYKQKVTLKGKTTERTHAVFASGRTNDGFVVEGWGGAGQAVIQVGEDGVRIFEMDSEAQKSPVLFLKFPFKVGEKWDAALKIAGVERTLSLEIAAEEEVSVPAGKFKAFKVKVTCKDLPDFVAEMWYARDFGEVKSRQANPEGEIVSELEKFEKGQIRYRCAKCDKREFEQKECCGARMERAAFARDAKACRCEFVKGKGACKCLHCSGTTGSKCYCDTGGCECKDACKCAHCMGQDGGVDGLGNCRCKK